MPIARFFPRRATTRDLVFLSTPSLWPQSYFKVIPLHIIAFTTVPGDGSEPANFGLCRYPDLVVRVTVKVDAVTSLQVTIQQRSAKNQSCSRWG